MNEHKREHHKLVVTHQAVVVAVVQPVVVAVAQHHA